MPGDLFINVDQCPKFGDNLAVLDSDSADLDYPVSSCRRQANGFDVECNAAFGGFVGYLCPLCSKDEPINNCRF